VVGSKKLAVSRRSARAVCEGFSRAGSSPRLRGDGGTFFPLLVTFFDYNCSMWWKLKERQQKWLVEERGAVLKDWGGKLRVALAFPNRYAIGMSNLGFQTVYEAFNGYDQIVCERVFYPEAEHLLLLKEHSGRLLSVESQRTLRDFDILTFSLPFENDFSNAVEMIRFGGIPPLSEQRTSGDPFVAAGGIGVFMNPEPLAPFLDFVFVGEGEALIPDFLEFWQDNKNSRFSREGRLRALAREVQGIYVPSLYRVSYHERGVLAAIEPLPGSGAPAQVAFRRADLSVSSPCQTTILTPNTEFSNILLVEVGRGCGRGCRFCAAGFMYRPVRYHSGVQLFEAISSRFPDIARVGLVSTAVSDHPEIACICQELMDSGKRLSFSSLRADQITPEIVAALQASEHHAVAIAVEAGSERLRRVINKDLSREDITRAVELLTEGGILSLKLYFMIGLPTESLEDLEAIVEVAKGVKHHVLKISRGQKRLGTITLSVNAFIPKPFTAFQWASFAGVQELKVRAKWLQNALKKVPNVRIHFDVPKWAYVQALLSRGDRRVSFFLEKVALEGLTWPQAMRTAPLNPDFWVMRERDQDELFPWEIIDLGGKRAYLWGEYQRAIQELQTEPCKPDEGCQRCGICSVS
jgi:radical SAM superfamily enzyme YgiQ (UPF0313 family)